MMHKHTKFKLSLSAAALAIALAACGGGQSGSGSAGGQGSDVIGSMENGTTAEPRNAGQPTDQGPGTPTDTGNGAVSAPKGVVAIGVQPVKDTPVDALASHPGHEPLTSQVDSSPAPAAQTQFTREWAVSPSGNDSNPGTAAAPFKTLAKGIASVGPGEVLRVMGGSYPETLVLTGKDGNANAKITIQGEGKPKITGAGSGSSAIVQFKARFWVVDGFDIDAQSTTHWAASFDGNTEGSILANSELHNGTGSAGVNVYGNSTGAIIENNHIHNFRKSNDDSHGIVVQTTTHNTVIRNNDIHDVSGDSVQCLGPEGYSNNPPADGLVIESNHFYKAPNEGLGENAVDIKTCHNVTIRNNRMHGFRTAPANQGAKGDAVVVHLSAKNVTVEGNEIFDSGKGIALGGNRLGGPMPAGVVIRRNNIHDLVKEGVMEGTGIRVENSDAAVIVQNTIWNVPGYGMVLGHGTNGPTQNLTLKNNIIGGTGLALDMGGFLPGMQADGNLYAAGAQFRKGDGTTVAFTQWQQAGQDAHSVTGDPGFQSGSFAPGATAVDKGQNVGLSFCGAAPDIGSTETGC